MLTRKAAREQAFILIFEKQSNNETIEEILNTAAEVMNFEVDDYVTGVFSGVYSNIDSIDKIISENSNGWKINRISRVALSLLRLAIYEILYIDDIPISVSANEAVELCKKYATTDDSSFINGILGTVSRKYGKEV